MPEGCIDFPCPCPCPCLCPGPCWPSRLRTTSGLGGVLIGDGMGRPEGGMLPEGWGEFPGPCSCSCPGPCWPSRLRMTSGLGGVLIGDGMGGPEGGMLPEGRVRSPFPFPCCSLRLRTKSGLAAVRTERETRRARVSFIVGTDGSQLLWVLRCC